MSRRSRLRYVITIALSFFLSLLLIALIAGVILLRTVVNPWYIVGRLENSGFAEKAHLELQEVFISFGLASGVSSEVMVMLITPEHIADAAEDGVMESFNVSGGYAFDAYSDEIYEVLYSYALSQGLSITDDAKDGLRSLADLCAQTLEDYVGSPIFDILAQAQHYRRHLFIAVAVSLFLSIIVVFLIPRVNHRVTRWIDGYLYALGTGVIICIMIPLVVHSTGITSRLQITPLSYNRFISSWIEGILDGFLVALIPLVLLIGVCVAVRIVRWKKRRVTYVNI